jgi:DNA-binding NarL/FixJ family response regulator
MDECRRVLFAGADCAFCKATADALRPMGFECDCAHDIAAAPRMVAATHYDVLVLDIGGAADVDAQLMRETRAVAGIVPIIVVTQHPTIETAMTAVEASVAAYLVKPIAFDHFLLHIRRSAARSRLHRTVTEVRARSALWDESVAKLQCLLQEPIEGSIMELAGPLLTTTFEGLVASVADLRRIIDCLAATNYSLPRSEVMAMWHKLDLTRTALRETVNVLEETKHAFKSKRLGELRRQLQGLLGVLEKD